MLFRSPDCQAERECCDMPEIVAAVGMPDIQPKPPLDGKERAVKPFCENPNCESPAVKEVPVSVNLPSDQKRSLCATCEEAYSWGVQHGVMTSWRPVWVLAVADRGVIGHLAVFRKRKDADGGLVDYLRTYHGYSGSADRKAVRQWLGEHDERLSVEISEQVIASPPDWGDAVS